MKVNEIFGGIQGEGINVGRPTIFIRFSGCNLNCKWCDTKYHKEGKEKSVEEILDYICSSLVDNITLTGGEPFVQNKEEMLKLIDGIHALGKEVYVETNGIVFDDDYWWRVDFFSISPKLPSSGDPLGNYMFGLAEYWHRQWNERVKIQLKYVVSNVEDIKRIKTDLRYFKIDRFTPIIFQPCTQPKETLKSYTKKAQELIKIIQDDEFWYDYNWRFLLQQHVVIFGKQRGV